jgi:two-component system LytT family response regulator
LIRLLGRHQDLIEVVGEADSGPSAVELAQQRRPDICFLDISLPGFDGFEVVDRLPSDVRVVFTTAHEEHAVQAFRANALDYLLKPIDPLQLAEALARLQDDIAAHESAEVVRLLCRDRDTTHVVEVRQILFLRAEGGYTHVQTHDAYYLTNESLTALEPRLGSAFVRVHRNTLVNLKHVSALRHGDGELIAALGPRHEVSVSRRYSQDFRRQLTYVQ